ncbi:MAG: hypothetical protein JTT11_05995 [Candidatus Brockarchaeota archaeon]|nr:hypothetical protein [Candidatus Brockarchaeota archaeon]
MAWLEAARKYLISAILAAVPIIIFVPSIIDYYPYEISLSTTQVEKSNTLWGGYLNNSVIFLPPNSAKVLPSIEGDFLQPASKRNYQLVGDAFSNASVTFAILGNDGFQEFLRNSSAVVEPLLRRDVAAGQTESFSVPVSDDGLYFYVFVSRELAQNAMVRFNLNETWTYDVVTPELRFSFFKGLVPPVAVFGGAIVLAVSLVKLRKIASETPEPEQPPAGT